MEAAYFFEMLGFPREVLNILCSNVKSEAGYPEVYFCFPSEQI
jgi:hypothetical protein